MVKKISNRYLIFLAAMLIMFLPRRIYIASVFSFRAVILALFLIYAATHKKIRLPIEVRSIFMMIYFIYCLMNYVFTAQAASGIGFLVDSIVLMCLMTSLIRGKDEFDYFLDIFIRVLAVYDVFGLIETFSGVNIYDVVSGSTAVNSIRFGLTRFCGAGLVSSNNANFLLLASVLVLYRIIWCDTAKKRHHLIAVYVLNAIALFCTLTRAPIMLFFALQIVWLFKAGLFKFIRKYIIQILAAVMIVTAIIIFVPAVNTLVTNFVSMFQALFDSATASSISEAFGSNAEGTGQRLQLYEWVAKQIEGSELFGKGANTPFIQEWTTSYGKRVVKNSLENHYLMMYYQFGAVGLITYIGHYLYMLLTLRKNAKANSKLMSLDRRARWNFCSMVMWGFVIMIPAMFVTGLFDELRMLYLMFALAVAVKGGMEYFEGE